MGREFFNKILLCHWEKSLLLLSQDFIIAQCSCQLLLLCWRYRVERVLLRRENDAEILDGYVTLDSLLSTTDDENSQSSTDAHSNRALQLFTSGSNNSDCNNAGISDVCESSYVISVNKANKRVMTSATLKQKPHRTKKTRTTDLNKNDSCQNVLTDNESSCFSPTISDVSQETSELAASKLTKDEMCLSNEHGQSEVKRYGLRKRKHCCLNDGQTDVPQNGVVETSFHRMDITDRTTGDQNQLTFSRSSVLPGRCLVLKQPVCCMCGLSFSSTSDCIQHCRHDHIVTDPSGNAKPHFACEQCPVTFAIPSSRVGSDLHTAIQLARWLSHAVRVHNFPIPSGVEKFTCAEPGCSFIGLTPASYQTHRQKDRHGSVQGASSLVYFKLCCFLCTTADGGREVFPSKAVLQEHIIEQHAKKDHLCQVLLCPVCKAQRQLTRPGVDGGRGSKRSSCRRFFYVIYRLLHHLVSKHGWSVPEFVRSFPCKFSGCRYVAVAQSDLDCHSISHDVEDRSGSSRNPSLSCEKCGKLVKFRAMRSHLQLCQVSLRDRQTQQCPFCSVRLSSKYNLWHHLKAIHSDSTTSKQFLCSYCTYSCHIKSNLEEHIFRRHGSNISQRTVVACSLCPFKTIKRSALHRHTSSVHCDAKTFQCRLCDKMFKCKRKQMSLTCTKLDATFLNPCLFSC